MMMPDSDSDTESQVTYYDQPLDQNFTSGACIPDVRVTADKDSFKEFGGKDLKTPSVSPNSSFTEVSE